MVHVTSPTSLAIESPQGRKLFVFDRVFGEEVNQEGIWEYVSESVRAFTQGYNVSVLAYGQSGAGKSYTMGTSGPLEQAETDQMGEYPAWLDTNICYMSREAVLTRLDFTRSDSSRRYCPIRGIGRT